MPTQGTPTTLTPEDIRQVVDVLDAQLSTLNTEPCQFYDRAADHPTICLEPGPGEGPSWRDMKPDRMCAGCRAYWYLSQSIDALRRAAVNREAANR